MVFAGCCLEAMCKELGMWVTGRTRQGMEGDLGGAFALAPAAWAPPQPLGRATRSAVLIIHLSLLTHPSVGP